jgi:ArsR family transcriptional regulator, arsenate/arsenite/antimonite-responsive transcriptional repressor
MPWGILKAADLVRTERRGQHSVYSLNATVLQETAAMLMDLFSPADKAADSGKSKRKQSTRNVK